MSDKPSNKFIQLYQQAKDEAEQAAANEAALVRDTLTKAFDDGLRLWFGDFHKELVFDGPPVYGTADVLMNSADASILGWFKWEGVSGFVSLTANQAKRSRTNSAKIEMFFEQEHLFGEALHRKEFTLQLPTDIWVDPALNKLGWKFSRPDRAVDALEFGGYLQEILEHSQAREVMRILCAADRRHDEYKRIGYEIENWSNAQSLQGCLEKAKEIFPEAAKRWQELYEKRAAFFLRMAEKEAAKLAQVAQYTAWINDWLAVLARNRQRLVEIQAVVGLEAFPVFRLEYAQVAIGDEGDPYVETETEYVTSDEPENGWFVSLEDGNKKKFAHWVSVTIETIHFATLPGRLSKSKYVKPALLRLQYPVVILPDLVDDMLNKADFETLPTDYPAGEDFSRERWGAAIDELSAESHIDGNARKALFDLIATQPNPGMGFYED